MTEVSSTSMVNDLLSRLDKVKERGSGKALGVSLVEKCECLYLSFEDNERRLKTRLCPQSTPPDGLRLFTEWLRLDDGGFEVLEECDSRRSRFL